MNLKKRVLIIATIVSMSMLNFNAYANTQLLDSSVILADQENDLRELIEFILRMKADDPSMTEDEMISKIDNRIRMERGIFDIWNSLTDSEKKLVIRYPLDALKVNEARTIAINQTELKFGYSGLGDRSDAFRLGIWNAKMTMLIGKTQAELFATAHEDKDTSGVETDGFSKLDHKNMDLHNNTVGRELGEMYADLSDAELANVIYDNIYQENSDFIWLHE